MSKLAKAFMLAAGLGLATAGPVSAVTVDSRPIDQPENLQQQTEPEESFLHEIAPRAVQTPQGIAIVPAPKPRKIDACVVAPEGMGPDTIELSMAFVLTASGDDMEAKGMTPPEFIATYGDRIQEGYDQTLEDVVARHEPIAVLRGAPEFVSDLNESLVAYEQQFEADEGITLDSPFQPAGAVANSPNCAPKP